VAVNIQIEVAVSPKINAVLLQFLHNFKT